MLLRGRHTEHHPPSALPQEAQKPPLQGKAALGSGGAPHKTGQEGLGLNFGLYQLERLGIPLAGPLTVYKVKALFETGQGTAQTLQTVQVGLDAVHEPFQALQTGKVLLQIGGGNLQPFKSLNARFQAFNFGQQLMVGNRHGCHWVFTHSSLVIMPTNSALEASPNLIPWSRIPR